MKTTSHEDHIAVNNNNNTCNIKPRTWSVVASSSLDWKRLNDGRKSVDLDDVVTGETCFFEQPLPVLFRPLFAAGVVSEKHHVKCNANVGEEFVAFGPQHVINDDHFPCFLWYCLPAVLQDLDAVLVAPVMQNPLHIYIHPKEKVLTGKCPKYLTCNKRLHHISYTWKPH